MTPRRRSLSDVIAETAPEPVAVPEPQHEPTPEPKPEPTPEPKPAPAARTPRRKPTPPPPPIQTGRRPAPVRSTMDLPPHEHADFLKWAVDASHITGQSVRGQNVLRALARRVISDPKLQAQILDDLREGRGRA